MAKNRDLAVQAYRVLAGTIVPNKTATYRRFGPFNDELKMRMAAKIEKVVDLGHSFRFKTTTVATWPYKTSILPRSGDAGSFTGKAYNRSYSRTYPMTYTVLEGEGEGASRVTLTNNGNADAFPVLEITGPLTANSWSILNVATGKSMSFATDINSGQTLVVDCRARTAKIGSADQDFYIRGDWLYLPAGYTSEFRLMTGTANPSARFTVTMADTWR